MELSKADSNDNFCFYRSINTKKINLVWEITSICNLNCKHCFRCVSNEELNFEDKYKVVAKFDKNIIGRVLITGGEPLLVENITKILQEIQAKEIPVKVVSNLSFDKEVVASILRELASNFEISTSIDGHNDKIHGYVRGQGKFEVVCENIKYLTNHKINVSVICVITKKNILYVEDIIKLCKDIGVKTLTFSKMLKNESSPQSRDFYITNVINEQEEIDFVSNIQELRKTHSGFNIRTVGFVSNKCVDAGKNILFVTPQGEVHPCSMMRYNVEIPNIMNYSINEIVDKIKNTSEESFIRLCSSLNYKEKLFMKTRKAVGAIIVNKKNEVLLAHKVKIMDGNKPKTISEWDFIKGGMKEGEDTITALKRELLEEANIKKYIVAEELPEFAFEFTDELKNILKYDNQVTYFFKILVDTDKTDIRPDFDEVDELRFVSVNEAFDLMCHDTSKAYLKKIIDKGLLV